MVLTKTFPLVLWDLEKFSHVEKAGIRKKRYTVSWSPFYGIRTSQEIRLKQSCGGTKNWLIYFKSLLSPVQHKFNCSLTLDKSITVAVFRIWATLQREASLKCQREEKKPRLLVWSLWNMNRVWILEEALRMCITKVNCTSLFWERDFARNCHFHGTANLGYLEVLKSAILWHLNWKFGPILSRIQFYIIFFPLQTGCKRTLQEIVTFMEQQI